MISAAVGVVTHQASDICIDALLMHILEILGRSDSQSTSCHCVGFRDCARLLDILYYGNFSSSSHLSSKANAKRSSLTPYLGRPSLNS